MLRLQVRCTYCEVPKGADGTVPARSIGERFFQGRPETLFFKIKYQAADGTHVITIKNSKRYIRQASTKNFLRRE